MCIFVFLIEVFLLYWRVADSQAVVVSGGQQRDSAIHIYVCPFSPRLPSRPGCHIALSKVPCALRGALLAIRFILFYFIFWPSVLNTAVLVTVSHSLSVFHSAGYKPTT